MNPPWHSLDEKRIWITGGAGYLGAPITEALDQGGARTVCVDLDGRADALVDSRKLSRTTPVSCDVNDTTKLEELIPRLISAHGVPDGVVHLAYASSIGKRMEDLTPKEFQRTFDQALPSTYLLCRMAAEAMRPRKSGSIILFASMYGVVSPDPRNYIEGQTPNPIDYGASKAAMLQMARYLAVHYGPDGIRFNCVTPGPFPNPTIQKANVEHVRRVGEKTALRRIGQNHEVVGPTLFLLTDSASFVTGHSLVVDGGWTAW